jgi:4-amino-4-deoxy-L-arabinose transferase-like glycosyltransferase
MTVWLAHLLNLAWVSIVGITATAAGRRVCRVAGWRLSTLTERVVLAAGLGLAFLAYLIWAVGIIGWLTPPMLWGVLVGLTILGLPEWPLGWRMARGVMSPRKWRLENGLISLLIGMIVVQVGLIVLANLAPLSAGDPTYYMAPFRQYLYEERIVWWPILSWNYPQLTGMLYTLAMGTRGDIAMASIGSMLTLLCIGVVWALARRYVSQTAAWLAVALVVIRSDFYTYATIIKVELAMIVFLVLGWLALLHWYEGHGHRWLVLVGLCAGLAASTKYQGLIAAGSLGVAACLGLFLGRGQLLAERGRLLGAVALAVAGAVVVMLPWYGRNWLLGGDPIWPLGYPIFSSLYYTAEEFQKFANWERGLGSSFFHFIIGPWLVTTRSSAYGTNDFRTIFTPVFLAFLPGLALIWSRLSIRKRRVAVLLLIGMGSSYTVWFFGGYQKLGYLFPMLVPAMVVTVIAIEGIWSQGKVLQVVTSVGLVVALVLSLVASAFQSLVALPYITGAVDRDAYLSSKVSLYGDLRWANANLPRDAKVLSLDLHPYYLERRLILGAPAYSGVLDYSTLRSPEELLVRLRSEEFTHILAPGRPLNETFAKASRELWPDTDLGNLVKVLMDTGYIVEIYHNLASRIISSRTFGWEDKGEYYIYEVRYP